MIETERLVMRRWRADDVAPFQQICSDPLVMATLGPPLDISETAALVERMHDEVAAHGCCFWALERREDARLIGWCGTIRGTAGPIAGKAELGWRLASDCWGHGYATEAARGALDWTFENMPDDAAWAITAVSNRASRAVMERLNMTHCPALDFDHPRVPEDSPLRPHVAYRIERATWEAAA